MSPTSSAVMFRLSGATFGHDVEDLREAADLSRAGGLDRSGGDRVDTDAARPQIVGEVSDDRLERGLRDAGDVVVRYDLRSAQIRERHDRRVVVQVIVQRVHESDERVRRDIQRQGEAVARRVVDRAREIVFLDEGDRVDEDVELAELFGERRARRGERRVVRDVALDDGSPPNSAAISSTDDFTRSP